MAVFLEPSPRSFGISLIIKHDLKLDATVGAAYKRLSNRKRSYFAPYNPQVLVSLLEIKAVCTV